MRRNDLAASEAWWGARWVARVTPATRGVPRKTSRGVPRPWELGAVVVVVAPCWAGPGATMGAEENPHRKRPNFVTDSVTLYQIL